MLSGQHNGQSAEQRIHKAAADILGKDRYMALSGIFMEGSKRIDDSVPTAHTDGLNEVYGRRMVDAINDAELRYLMLHECKHKMYQHLLIWEWMWKEDPDCANAACDYVINLELDDENADGWAKMPSGGNKGLVDERFRGMNAAQVFKILKSEGFKRPAGTGFDEHDWENAKQRSPAEKEAMQKRLDNALRQGALMAGRYGSPGSALDLEALLQPQVRWEDELRQFAVETVAGVDFGTFARPNRRYLAAGVYMPTCLSEAVGEIAVLADTSGSCRSFITHWLSEIKAICDDVMPDKLHLIYWDTKVAGHEVYDSSNIDSLVDSTVPKGGGGTTINYMPMYLAENNIAPKAVIVLTDGDIYGGWGQWDAPTLWCIVNNDRVQSPVGKTLHITTH